MAVSLPVSIPQVSIPNGINLPNRIPDSVLTSPYFWVIVFLLLVIAYSPFAFLIYNFMRKRKIINANIFEVADMPDDEFFIFLTNFFRRLGYKVVNPGKSLGGAGVDLIIIKDNVSTMVRGKNQIVGNDVNAVKEVEDRKNFYKTQNALLIANLKQFTPLAINYATSMKVELWDNKIFGEKILEAKSRADAKIVNQELAVNKPSVEVSQTSPKQQPPSQEK